jgi:hypothetical protein
MNVEVIVPRNAEESRMSKIRVATLGVALFVAAATSRSMAKRSSALAAFGRAMKFAFGWAPMFTTWS